MIVRAPCMAKCESLVHTYHDAPWPRGQTPVLLNLGTVFDSPRVLRAILNTLAPLGAGVSVITLFRGDCQGSLKGHYICMTTVFFLVHVPGSILL